MTRLLFGEIAGYPEGSTFKDRWALHIAGVHRPTQAGICGSGKEGAESIVLNGGYEDDEDGGDVIIYTGQGGIDRNTGEPIADQELTRGNLALTRNKKGGKPVRVIRGAKNPGPYGPKIGFRYDGLYGIEDYWSAKGNAGYLIWRFKLVKE